MSEALPAHQRHSDASAAAAAAIRKDTSRLRMEVYRLIKKRGKRGCTDEEGDAALALGGNTYRPRRVELVEKGWIEDSGTKRPAASGRMATVMAEEHNRAVMASLGRTPRDEFDPPLSAFLAVVEPYPWGPASHAEALAKAAAA